MSQKPFPFSSAMLITLLGGAALGAVAMALTTPKTGKEVRDRFRILANRVRGKAVTDDQADEGGMEMLFI